MANGGLRKEIDLYYVEEDGCWFVGMVGMGVWWVLIEESMGLYVMQCFVVGLPCDAMLCCWFAVGLIEEELVKEGREDKAEHREA